MWKLFCSEVTEAPFFASMEYDDMQKAFFPSGTKVLVCKVLLRGWTFSCLAKLFAGSQYPVYELAYLTNWSLAVTVLYLSLSFLMSLSPSYFSMPESSEPTKPGFAAKALTILFSVAAIQELVVLLFWIDPIMVSGDMYVLILAHGPLSILVLLDGLVINSIPVRAKHIVFPWIFQLFYLLWSLIYSILDIKNPHLYMVDGNPDGGIYPGKLNWRLYPGNSVIMLFGILFILTPGFFASIMVLSLSIKSWQRPQEKPPVEDRTDVDLSNSGYLEEQAYPFDQKSVMLDLEWDDSSEITV